MRKILSDVERASLETRIAKIENATAAEIVIAVVPRAGSYAKWAPLFGLAVGAGVGAIGLFGRKMDPVNAGGPLQIVAVALAAFGVATLAALIPRLQALLLPASATHNALKLAARKYYVDRKLGTTKDQTAILVMIGEFERDAVVLADHAVETVVGDGFWMKQEATLRDGIRRGEASTATHKVLSELGGLLGAKLPARRDDRNELPNKIDLKP